MEPEIISVTVWDLLAKPQIGLHLPRFAAFLFAVIIVEILCNRKKVCLTCSLATAGLLTANGLAGIASAYFLLNTEVVPGSRFHMPAWFIPGAGLLLTSTGLLFLVGVREIINEGFRGSAVCRSIVFTASVYFAITTMLMPFQVNNISTGMDFHRSD